MAESSLTPGSHDDLQFTTAEPAQAAAAKSAPTCATCAQPIGATYYALGNHVICPACCQNALTQSEGKGFLGFVKASLFGIGAGLVGALIWFIIRRAANLEIGLVAILVGFMVGKAVFKGSGSRGGLGYQILAVLITYCCIAANYMPDILEAVFENARQERVAAAAAPNAGQAKANDGAAEADVAAPEVVEAHKGEVNPGMAILAVALLLVLAFAFALAAPFLAGAQNLIGLLIIGFALWESWKFNARRELPITGPYEMGASPAI